MWWEAQRQHPQITGLAELEAVQYEACLQAVHVYYIKHQSVRKNHGLEKDKGPAGFGDRLDGSRVHYNGEGGGRMYKWYLPGLFRGELLKLGTTADRCNETQCMQALSVTNAVLVPVSYTHLTLPTIYSV